MEQALNVKAEIIREDLELSYFQWENLLSWTRATHSYMSNTPGNRWGDIDTGWSEIPASEKERALEMMNDQCKEIFGDRLHTEKVKSAIVNRLYQTRRSWQAKRRQKRRAQKTAEDSGVEVSTSKPAVEVVDRGDVMAVSSLLQSPDKDA